MNNRNRDRVLALAGVFQAARLVQQLAREGRPDKNAFAASINSILMIDAGSTEEVYGGVAGAHVGLQILHEKLPDGNDSADLEIAKYVVSLMQLENIVRRRPDLMEAIRRGIEAAEAQMKFFEREDEEDTVHPSLVEKLAELYTKTISTLTPRILVNGEQSYLANPPIAAKIRSALLAGIRSAVLWRQLGGSRWQLLFGRRKIAALAGKILDEQRGGAIDRP